MGRPKKIEATTNQIEKAEELVLKTKAAYDEAVRELKILREKEQKEKQAAILSAISKSRHSYDEIMKYIQSDFDNQEE